MPNASGRVGFPGTRSLACGLPRIIRAARLTPVEIATYPYIGIWGMREQTLEEWNASRQRVPVYPQAIFEGEGDS